VRWLNIPNALSLSRLALTPFSVHAVLAGEYRTALALFFIAAVTDILDGPLARRFGCTTRLGTYLDPIADKAMLSATYLAAGIAGLVPGWLVALIFGRDFLILALASAALLFTRHRDFPPSVWGKLSTAVQTLVGVLVVLGRAFPALRLPPGPLLAATAATTAWSGLHYLWRALRMLQRPCRAN
jgi:cardiolipin synthase (CMP-forming)